MENSGESVDAGEVQYVGFWVRFIAFIVDSIWALILVALVVGAILGAPDIEIEAAIQDPIGVLVSLSGRLIFETVLVALAIILFWLFRSATPGKMLFSAEIVDAKTFKKPTTLQFIIRYVAYFLSTFVLMLGFIWIAFDKRKQGWHDKLAGTVVISSNK